MKIEKNKSGNWELTNKQELVSETSYNVTPVGEHEYTMELYLDDDGVPTMIEWDVPSLDIVESIGLWFEGKDLCDYDGIMGYIPLEAAMLIRHVGYEVGNDFLDEANWTKEVEVKEDLKNYLAQDDKYFSEGHLMAWFNSQYLGKKFEDAKHNLESVHDTSGEIENAENELDRELEDEEKELVIRRFNESVLNSIVCHRKTVVAFVDSLGETCVKGYN